MGVTYAECNSCGECCYEGTDSYCRRCHEFICEGCLEDCTISEKRKVYECPKCANDEITDAQCRVMLEYALKHPVKRGSTIEELRELMRRKPGKLKRCDYAHEDTSSEEEEEEKPSPPKRQKVTDD